MKNIILFICPLFLITSCVSKDGMQKETQEETLFFIDKQIENSVEIINLTQNQLKESTNLTPLVVKSNFHAVKYKFENIFFWKVVSIIKPPFYTVEYTESAKKYKNNLVNMEVKGLWFDALKDVCASTEAYLEIDHENQKILLK